jgi:hypothetical protein
LSAPTPTFTYTVPQGSLGTLDHVKGLTFIKTAYAPGPREGTVSGTATISAESYGVVDHPFPSQYVTNANDDVRLGSCSLNAIDPDNMIVADFFMTNEGLYAWYERLPFVRTNTNFYRAFSQAYRVGDRSPEDFHRLGVVYDKKCRSISWTLDDEVVFQVKMIGYLSHKPGVVTMVDLGGDETLVTPTRFQFGFGCFTLLDMNDYWNPSNQGLVQIGDNNAVEYYNPTNFWDTNSYGEDRLWGQGAHIRIDRFVVEVE